MGFFFEKRFKKSTLDCLHIKSENNLLPVLIPCQRRGELKICMQDGIRNAYFEINAIILLQVSNDILILLRQCYILCACEPNAFWQGLSEFLQTWGPLYLKRQQSKEFII